LKKALLNIVWLCGSSPSVYSEICSIGLCRAHFSMFEQEDVFLSKAAFIIIMKKEISVKILGSSDPPKEIQQK
jgi:hypothetical protein